MMGVLVCKCAPTVSPLDSFEGKAVRSGVDSMTGAAGGGAGAIQLGGSVDVTHVQPFSHLFPGTRQPYSIVNPQC